MCRNLFMERKQHFYKRTCSAGRGAQKTESRRRRQVPEVFVDLRADSWRRRLASGASGDTRAGSGRRRQARHRSAVSVSARLGRRLLYCCVVSVPWSLVSIACTRRPASTPTVSSYGALPIGLDFPVSS